MMKMDQEMVNSIKASHLDGFQGRRRMVGVLDRLGAALYPGRLKLDVAAFIVVGLALTFAAVIFLLVPADPARLARFTAEDVEIFNMADSTRQRLAFIAFVAILFSGAAGLRLIGPLHDSTISTGAGAWPRRMIALIALSVLAINIRTLIKDYGVPTQLLELALYLVYLAAAAVFVWNNRFPRWLVRGTIGLVLLLACAPAATELMLRIDAFGLPWVDFHLAAMFSNADMLAFGYRLFADVSVSYGLIVPVALVAALRAGGGLDLGALIHLTQAFQVITLCLFAFAAWTRARDSDGAGRAAAVLLVLLVAAPFLSTSNNAVFFPQASGLRFVMLPVAALAAIMLDRWSLIPASLLVGTIATIALLHNTETGIAILAGLGLGWLVRARAVRPSEFTFGALAGLTAGAALMGLAALAYFSVFGFWPSIDFSNPIGLAQDFGAGFGGFLLPKRVAVFVVLGYAGYVVTRALACILGRAGLRPDSASAAIAGMLIAWAPYYVNRPSDSNFWTFLALFAVLLAPGVARASARSGQLAALAIILLVPIPLGTIKWDAQVLAVAATMKVNSRCAAGLSLTPDDCAVHGARVAELKRIAAPGDIVWMTAYPFLTLRLSGLRPPVPTLDPFFTARTEARFDTVAAEIKAARPIALVLDGTNSSASSAAIPAPMRSFQTRMALRIGFAPCPLISLFHWQVWLPLGTCHEGDDGVTILSAR
jgi:hypothetical protein